MSGTLPVHERSLFVIEQQGKRSRVAYLLLKAGFTDFEVQPTYGALFDLPRNAIAINPTTLLVTSYEVQRREVALRLRELAASAARVFVMTDADREGELIAAQVRQICSDKPLFRLRMRALTADALAEALRSPTRIDIGAATASASRRIIDRIIGYGFSKPSLGRVGIVGRVQTAALSAFDRNPVACGEWGGRLTVSQLEARGVITNRTVEDAKRIEQLLAHASHELERLPRHRVRKLLAPPRPCNCADAILEGRRRLGIPTREAERILQSRYQEGELSYVRSDSSHIGPEARSIALSMARKANLTIARDAEDLYQRPSSRRGLKHAHEALHPTAPLDISVDPAHFDKSDGLMLLIARRLAISMAAPVEIDYEVVSSAALREFIGNQLGESAAQVDFQLMRPVTQRPVWMQWLSRSRNQSPPKMELYGADATALSFLAGSSFGRPSNQIRFVDSLLDNGFINEVGNVTPMGQAALTYAKEHAPFLLDPARIEAVEELLDQNQDNSVPTLVESLCDVMGLPVEMAQTAVADWYLANRMPAPGAPTPELSRTRPATVRAST